MNFSIAARARLLVPSLADDLETPIQGIWHRSVALSVARRGIEPDLMNKSLEVPQKDDRSPHLEMRVGPAGRHVTF
jgi:hypothetical protein